MTNEKVGYGQSPWTGKIMTPISEMTPISLDELQRRMPTTLDEVIGRKDVAVLRLATSEDLTALDAFVPTSTVPKARLSHWYVVVIDSAKAGKRLNWWLFGTNVEDGMTNGTSRVMARSRDGTRFLTKSGSEYEVVGEPSTVPDLPYLCGYLNYFGLGQDLGVVPIYL